MNAMTVEELMRQVRTLPLPQRKRLIGLIVDLLTEHGGENAPRSILELEGLGPISGRGWMPQEYVDDLRREWDERP